MPSPFPGVDPYLEAPGVWPGFHQRFITYLGELIQRDLPPPFYADIGERVFVEVSGRDVFPDVAVKQRPFPRESSEPATALLDTPVVVEVEPDEQREVFLEIRDPESGDQVVTTIELLSHANKAAGTDGQDLYLRKQREMLESAVNLVEIDLLRAGRHSTAVPKRDAVRQVGTFDYHVCVHRATERTKFEVYAAFLKFRLPAIGVPLTPETEDVRVDLQAVCRRCYDVGPYDRRIDYSVPPAPPLPPELQQWAQGLVAR